MFQGIRKIVEILKNEGLAQGVKLGVTDQHHQKQESQHVSGRKPGAPEHGKLQGKQQQPKSDMDRKRSQWALPERPRSWLQPLLNQKRQACPCDDRQRDRLPEQLSHGIRTVVLCVPIPPGV